MTTNPNRLPLWKVMREAYNCSFAPGSNEDDWDERDGFAAQILAVRDHIFPNGRPDPVGVSLDCLFIWDELTAEAERAEMDE